MTVPVLTASKVRTALKRTISPAGGDLPNHYLVAPNPVLGDTATLPYGVMWDPATGRHDCPCYTGFQGSRRRAEGCTHVVAAVLYARKQAAIADLTTDRELEHEAEAIVDTAPLPLPSDLRFTPPGEQPFADWVQSFRRLQWKAIEDIAACFEDGAKVVMFQGPPGSGKTLAGETVRRLVGGRGLYVCTTKSLQNQVARDFPYARVLKGRANYPTLLGDVTQDAWGRAGASSGEAVTCGDCTSTAKSRQCRWCDPVNECPYRVARDAAQKARLAILNTSYFLTDANKGGGKFAGRELAVLDEADQLESELLNQVEVKISKARMRRLKMAPPQYKSLDEKRGRGPAEAWGPWVVGEALPRVRDRLLQLPGYEDGSTAEIRERKGLTELAEKLETLAIELPGGKWVYDGYGVGDVIFRPIEVGKWGRSLLWPHAKRFLLMSGTIISADELAGSLGMDGDYRLVDVPMTFPAANRPVRIVALAEVTAKNQEQSWPKIAKGLAGVLVLHPDDRVLVHTVSYSFATFLMGEMRKVSRRPLVTYRDARERDEALRRYRETPGAVLLAPSMDRGIDLPGDACRVQVIAKVPYPNLGDKRTSARLYGGGTGGKAEGEAWYSVNTVRTLVQMTGRGVRSDEDHAVTYILDHSFTSNLWRKNKKLLPGWWCEAVDWRFPVHRLLRAGMSASSAAS